MSDIRDLDRLDDRLRLFGVPVREIAGWETRGHGRPGDGYTPFTPIGGGNHHTAGGMTGVAPSLGICINGRPDVPGPLCNVLQDRDDVANLIAAYKANHGGKGSWRGRSGNSLFYGLEIEHVGTTAEKFSPKRFDIAARIQAAFAYGRYDATWLWQHRQYAPLRKVDFCAALINDERFLDAVQWYIDHPPGLAPAIVKPVPQPRLVQTLRIGMRDKPDNPVIRRVEDLLQWNAVKYGEPNRGPGKRDGVFTGKGGTATSLVYFRRRYYDFEQAFVPKEKRVFVSREFPGVSQGDLSNVAVGPKIYGALHYAAAA